MKHIKSTHTSWQAANKNHSRLKNQGAKSSATISKYWSSNIWRSFSKERCLMQRQGFLLPLTIWLYLQPVSAADLVVETSQLIPDKVYQFEPAEWRYTIRNVGKKPSGKFSYFTIVEGRKLTLSNNLQNLDPGESYSSYALFRFANSGEQSVRIELDTKNEVAESNENNNIFEQPVPVAETRYNCRSDLIKLRSGETDIRVCHDPKPGAVRKNFPSRALERATKALPLIERFYGGRFDYRKVLVVMSDTKVAHGGRGRAFIGGGGTNNTVDWLMLHELIHSSCTTENSVLWFNEASSNIGATIINASLSGLNMTRELGARYESTVEEIQRKGQRRVRLETIRTDYEKVVPLGDIFLMDVISLVGFRPLANANRMLCQQQQSSQNTIGEKEIGEALLAKTPEPKQCPMYQQLYKYMRKSDDYVCKAIELRVMSCPKGNDCEPDDRREIPITDTIYPGRNFLIYAKDCTAGTINTLEAYITDGYGNMVKIPLNNDLDGPTNHRFDNAQKHYAGYWAFPLSFNDLLRGQDAKGEPRPPALRLEGSNNTWTLELRGSCIGNPVKGRWSFAFDH